MPKDGGIGASTVRREDIRFLTGKGRYTADINLRGQGYACFVRSEVAHGKINKIDTTEALAMPGVLAVMTGEDFAAMGGNPAGWLINSRDGTPMRRHNMRWPQLWTSGSVWRLKPPRPGQRSGRRQAARFP